MERIGLPGGAEVIVMGRWMTVSVLGIAALAFACGGGGSGGSGAPSSSLLASFLPDETSPGANTVAMAEGSKSGDAVTVAVNVSQTSDVYAAAFEVTFDSAKVTYVNHSAGTVLEQGGHTPTYQVGSPSAGRLVIGVSRNGNVPSVNVSSPAPIVRLTFRVKERGSFRLSVENQALYDGQAPPQPKAGIVWRTGVAVGN